MKVKIPTLAQLKAVSLKENGEPLVDLSQLNPSFLTEVRRTDAGINTILMRETLFHKLQKIQSSLGSNLKLLVVEGLRVFTYQERYFLKQMLTELEKNPTLDFDLLLEQTHQFVALPSVAGHPTGAAVDLTLVYKGEEVDMGTGIADFSRPELIPTFSKWATPEQAKWRKVLHDLMLGEGFAPFLGEWWHFSYGDREWAGFYDLSETLYAPIFDSMH